ncbi:MAG: hypothetical protein LUE15_05790 [Oscillospiraceae bacterium]|nr:hypothetical protein [Oscillospiraceae bacterium]
MVCVEDIFRAAMGLMDELSAEGEAQHEGTEEYERRAPIIVNTLLAELNLRRGRRGHSPQTESLDDCVQGVSDAFALSALACGLAANLLLDENPAAADFYSQRYEELRERYLASEAECGAVEDIYGGIERGGFGRW